MSRSQKKGPFVSDKLYRKVERQGSVKNKEPIKTWSRSCTIIPEFVGQTFLVHNGRVHVKVFVTEDMVGHKLGEFALTRVFKGHGGRASAAEAAAAATTAPAAAPAAPAAKPTK